MKQFSIILLLILSIDGCSSNVKNYQLLPASEAVIAQSSLLAHVKYLASDQLKGRKTSTKASLQSATYIKNKLVKYDILPLPHLSGYFHHFDYYLNQHLNQPKKE